MLSHLNATLTFSDLYPGEDSAALVTSYRLAIARAGATQRSLDQAQFQHSALDREVRRYERVDWNELSLHRAGAAKQWPGGHLLHCDKCKPWKAHFHQDRVRLKKEAESVRREDHS